eukprot:3842371-Prymnesium_polylepis.1
MQPLSPDPEKPSADPAEKAAVVRVGGIGVIAIPYGHTTGTGRLPIRPLNDTYLVLEAPQSR